MKNLISKSCKTTPQHRGVSLVEVLFAMMIALFGLAGVLAIIPLAIRQASDSYQLNHATNGALSISAIAAAADSLLPSDKSPWVFVDDKTTHPSSTSNDPFNPPLGNSLTNTYGVHPYKPVKSLDSFYVGLQLEMQSQFPALTTAQLLRINIGQGFCYDPLYVSYVNQQNWQDQGKTWNLTYGSEIIRPTRMPFFSEVLNLDSASGQFGTGSIATPRLIRVSGLGSRNATLPYPLSISGAEQLVSQLGDVIQATIQEDKSFGALREFEGADSGSLLISAGKADLSWLATIVPMESKDTNIPTQFKVSIVVIAKRDRSFEVPDPTTTISELPIEERVAFVSAMGDVTALPVSSGPILNTTLHFDNRTEADLKVGNYIMLSRFVLWNLPDSSNALERRPVHRHRWYRIIGVGDAYDTDTSTGSPQISRDVVLQGQPWDYPDLDATMNTTTGGATVPVAADVPTIATIMDNIVAVYEYPVDIR